MSDEADQRLNPAERRLAEHLELLRAGGPEPGGDLASRIVRSARWQRAVREPLRVAGMIASSLLSGLGTLLGGRR